MIYTGPGITYNGEQYVPRVLLDREQTVRRQLAEALAVEIDWHGLDPEPGSLAALAASDALDEEKA